MKNNDAKKLALDDKHQTNPEDSAKDYKETPKSAAKKPQLASIDVYAAQCAYCCKWRAMSTQEEYEEIRSKLIEEPFVCEKILGVSCDDPADMNYDATRIWVIDKPNLPKTPKAFERSLLMRRDFSKLDAYYHTPKGKRLKSLSEVEAFIKANPEYGGVSMSEFTFSVPRVMKHTIPDNVAKEKKAPACCNSNSNKKTKK